MNDMALWLMSAMVGWVPPRTVDAVRYASIADDIIEVAAEAPVFPGEDGIARTALLMAAIASYESSYRADVDSFQVRGDHGRSHGLMQVQLRTGEKCPDRTTCLRLGRERIRESLDACRALPFAERLSVYASGRCMTSAASRRRMGRAVNYWTKAPYKADEQGDDAADAPDVTEASDDGVEEAAMGAMGKESPLTSKQATVTLAGPGGGLPVLFENP